MARNNNKWALDVVLDGNARPLRDDLPVAMTFGWVLLDPEDPWGEGQGPGRRPKALARGDHLCFSVVDSSGTLDHFDSIEITFRRSKDRARKKQKKSPIDTRQFACTSVSAQTFGSTGCNIHGAGATSPPYVIKNKGSFDGRIVVSANGQIFQVDLELSVRK